MSKEAERPAGASPLPAGSGSGGGGNQYHCDYCRKDISHVVRIKCAVCNDFDLCLECFSVGVEVYPHKNDHDYRVMDHVTQPIFEEKWGADEELLLLEGIEMYGLGNWSDVADHVGNKSARQCERHYYDVYLNSDTAPLPDLNQPLLAGARPGTQSAEDRSKVKDKGQKVKVKQTGIAELVGYIPNRGDYETEWCNDAETLIADMEFRPEDTKLEQELKIKVLRIYNDKLDGRAARKQFVLERGLLNPSKEKKERTPEEREIENNVRFCARFHSKEQHEEFLQHLFLEHRLRRRIEQLQHYRTMGIRTFADAERYEAEIARKEAQGMLVPEPMKSHRRLSFRDEMRLATLKRRRVDRPDGVDVLSMAGHELLSQVEKQLCAEIRLPPQLFLLLKEQIVREAYARNVSQDQTGPNQRLRQVLTQIDTVKRQKVWDFFVQTGWVNGAAVGGTSAMTSPSFSLPAPTAAAATASAGPSSSSATAAPSYPPLGNWAGQGRPASSQGGGPAVLAHQTGAALAESSAFPASSAADPAQQFRPPPQ